MIEPRRDAFPFIVGSPRSGTTLVRAMLDSHPLITIPPESHFVVPFLRRRWRYERGAGRFDIDLFLRHAMEHRRLRDWRLDEHLIEDAVRSARPRDTVAALRCLFRLYADTHGKARYGDKTPRYVRSIPLLAARVPESVFVHVVRDGRDVALSLLAQTWGPDSIEGAAWEWRRSVVAARRARSRLPDTRFLEMRYESLVGDPERASRALVDFVQVDYEPEMLEYQTRADDIVGPLHSPESHRSLRLPPTRGLRDWRTEMERSDIERFEAVAGRALSSYGYERCHPRVVSFRHVRTVGRLQRFRLAGFRHRAFRRLPRLTRAAIRRLRTLARS